MNTTPRTFDGKFIAGFSYSKETQFVKGQQPANKGKKFPGSGNKESYKKGHAPHNTRYDGAITIRTNSQGNSYKFIRLGNKNWEFLQKHNWIQENGPIPEGKILCCKDGNSLNCDPSNWELKTRAEHASTNRNRNMPVKKTCPICQNQFETRLSYAIYCSDECQREKSRTKMREFQRAKRAENNPVILRNCIVCGKEFTPEHLASKICSEECQVERQKVYNTRFTLRHSKTGTSERIARSSSRKANKTEIGKCIQCGQEFTKTTPLSELCSYRCKRDRRNELRGKWMSLKEKKKEVKKPIKCIVCGEEFIPKFGAKICSSECRIKASKITRQKYYATVKANKPVKEKTAKPVNIKSQKPIRVKPIKPVIEKPIKQVIPILKASGHRKKSEKDAAINMALLNTNAPANDKERLQARNIESPKISEMPYKFYDKAMKITRFFRTEEKYNNYLKKQENEKSN